MVAESHVSHREKGLYLVTVVGFQIGVHILVIVKFGIDMFRESGTQIPIRN